MPFWKPRTVTPTAAGGGLPAVLQAVHPYPGPQAAIDPRTSAAILGLHTHLTPALWPLTTPGYGLHSGLIVGATGSGTSVLATQLAVTAAHTGRIALGATDLRGDTDLPALLAHAHHTARTPGEATDQMRAAVTLLRERQTRLALGSRAIHQPSPERPGLLLIVEDLPGLFDARSPLTPLALRIAREGRKTAIALIVITRDPRAVTIVPELRDQLAQANLAALRLPSTIPPPPGLPADPRDIPAGLPGTGYLARHPQPFRGWHLTQHDAARHLATAPRIHPDLAPLATRGRS